MIPLSSPDIHRRTTPYVTSALITASLLVFLYQLSLYDLESFLFTYKFGAIPAEVLGNSQLTQVSVLVGRTVQVIDVSSPIPEWATMFTSMFMHAGFLHLGGNMLFLWSFGKNIEGRWGHPAFLLLYAVSGLVAVVSQSIVDPTSITPMVGASGAVAGILGAYILLYPFSRINTLILVGLIMSIRVPAVVFIGFWAALQYFNGIASLGPEVSSGGVAYFAHLGGFIFGLVFAFLVLACNVGRRLWSKCCGSSRVLIRTGQRLRPNGLGRRAALLCPRCKSGLSYFTDRIYPWYCERCELVFPKGGE